MLSVEIELYWDFLKVSKGMDYILIVCRLDYGSEIWILGTV